MRLINDPSIVPTLTLDSDGNILTVRTYGLDTYGFYDFIMNENFNNYEQVFEYCIGNVLSLTFDYQREWIMYNQVYHVQLIDNLAYIREVDLKNEVKILTVEHPVRRGAMRYQTTGLRELNDHPELFMNAQLSGGRSLLSSLVFNVQNGETYSEDTVVTYGNKTILFKATSDRFGRIILELVEGV